MLTTLAIATAMTLQPGAGGSAQPQSAFYNFNMRSIDGAVVPMRNFRGRVLLVVNVASRCGLAPQFEGLQAIYEKYRDRGLTVLGFPSNSFKQEPGTEAEIRRFCTENFGVTFPMFARVEVAGESPHPLFRWLTQATPDRKAVEWNFAKFLISRDGAVLRRFAPRVAPDSPEVIKAIEAALRAAAAPGMGANPGGGPGLLTTRP
jgi:glutathione peroxidase